MFDVLCRANPLPPPASSPLRKGERIRKKNCTEHTTLARDHPGQGLFIQQFYHLVIAAEDFYDVVNYIAQGLFNQLLRRSQPFDTQIGQR
ncbi:MAG: hypothetical protein NTV49_07035 [Kiritimatiellaeota bacterium]|nr:hypothetical protein [Kiritimatiellota bacterium]